MTSPDFNPFRFRPDGGFERIKIIENATPQKPAKEGELSREVVETAAKALSGSITAQEYSDILKKMRADNVLSKTETGFLGHLLAGANGSTPTRLYQKLADIATSSQVDAAFELVDFDENGDQQVDELDAYAVQLQTEGHVSDFRFQLLHEVVSENSTESLKRKPMSMDDFEKDISWEDRQTALRDKLKIQGSKQENWQKIRENIVKMVGNANFQWESGKMTCPHSPFLALVGEDLLSVEEATAIFETSGNLEDEFSRRLGLNSWNDTPADSKYELDKNGNIKPTLDQNGKPTFPKQPQVGDIAVFTDLSQKDRPNFSHIAMFTGEGWNVLSIQARSTTPIEIDETKKIPTFQQYLEGHAGTLSEVNQRALKIYQESEQANPTVETDLKTLIRSDFHGTGVIILSNPLL